MPFGLLLGTRRAICFFKFSGGGRSRRPQFDKDEVFFGQVKEVTHPQIFGAWRVVEMISMNLMVASAPIQTSYVT